MKEKKDPNHHMGKSTGYGLIDGVYHIAPLYRNEFEQLALRKSGIDQVVECVTSHAARDYEAIATMRHSIWERLYEDIGLVKGKPYIYQSDGTIVEGKPTDK